LVHETISFFGDSSSSTATTDSGGFGFTANKTQVKDLVKETYNYTMDAQSSWSQTQVNNNEKAG